MSNYYHTYWPHGYPVSGRGDAYSNFASIASIEVSTPPTDEPLDLAETKDWLRIETNDYDSEIRKLIRDARLQIEKRTRRAMLTQTLIQYYDAPSFPREFYLLRPPLQSVTSIKYVDNNAAEQTVDSALYTVDTTKQPGRIYLDYDQYWPTGLRLHPNNIYVTYVAGYTAITEIPEPLRTAMMMWVAHRWENRELVVFNQNPMVLPLGIAEQVEDYVIRWEYDF